MSWLLGLKLVSAAVVVGLLLLAWNSVRSAFEAKVRLPEVEAQLVAAEAKLKATNADLTTQIKRRQELERETAEDIATANATAHDLADKLRRTQAALHRAVRHTTTPACDTDDAGRKPGNSEDVERAVERVDRGIEAHLAASGRDAERLTRLQEYVSSLPQRCLVE